MSGASAIGGVTRTLRDLLADRMEVPDILNADAFHVTARPLQPAFKPDEANPQEGPRVNLFLYRVSENGALKNQEIPGHGHPGAYGHPPLSLDLHYLLTPHGLQGNGTSLEEVPAHLLLGSAMRVLHDTPVITEAVARVNEPVGQPILDRSLRGQVERVKVTLEPLTLEDVTKVFTALTVPYRLCATYVASVVQIESARQRSFPRPVREPPGGPRIAALPFRSPTIEEVRVRRGGREREAPYARVGDTLILLGTGFASAATVVALGGSRIPVAPQREGRIEVVVPDDPALQPGARDVAVIVGATGASAPGFRSNAAAFMLVPQLAGALVQGATEPRSLRLTGTRLWAETLNGETLVGRHAIPKTLYQSPSGTVVDATLPDGLPAFPVRCLVSAALPEPLPAGLPAAPQVQAQVGGQAKAVHLAAKPATRAAAARLLQEGLRAVRAIPALAHARVAEARDRLAVVAAGFSQATALAVEDEGADDTAQKLGLAAAAGSRHPYAYVSGALPAALHLTAAAPQLLLSVDGTDHPLALAAVPTTPAQAAALLQDALHAQTPFNAAAVALLGDQLLILVHPDADDAPGTMAFQGTAPDATTVAELGLAATLPVRMRANGAESLDVLEVRLPRLP